MNDLEKYFRQNDDKLIHKWMHYFDIYDRHFSRFRNKKITILEIGVSQGGSLQMWKNYFGPDAMIYGIDIDPKCKDLEEENVEIFIGSQSDRKFLREIIKKVPKFDILIDDGGHTMKQQKNSYEELFQHVNENGVYLCEDLHTSYWLEYAGGHRRKGTFIEYSKKFIDFLNAHHSQQRSLKVNDFTKSVESIHYYDSILVIEKRKMIPPTHEKSGKLSFQKKSRFPNLASKIKGKSKEIIILNINRILRFFRLPIIFQN